MIRISTLPIRGNHILLKLANQSGLEVSLSNLGAAIFSIEYRGKIMTLTPQNPLDFEKEEIYWGKTIGPIAGRIYVKDLAKFGEGVSLVPNESTVVRHGGIGGLSSVYFRYEILDNGIRFAHTGEHFSYKITYILNDENELNCSIDVKPIDAFPLALTNHCFFCLGDASLSKLKLQLKASRFVEPDPKTLVPLAQKDVLPCLDFRNLRNVDYTLNDPYLMNSRTKGIDHCFYRDDDSPILLENDRFRLSIQTDFPCIHVYADCYADGVKAKNTDLTLRRALAIEPQDDPLNRQIPRGHYRRGIVYRFESK